MSIAAILESCNPVFNAIRRQDTAARKTDHKNPVSAMISEDLLYGQQWLSQPGIDTLRLRANDGASLQGYYRPALLKSDKLAILIHGYRADARMMAKYADLYRAWGYNVFMADNRGHGHSGGAYVGMGWLDRLDYQQWLQLLLTRYGNAQQVVIHGISMGASAALMMSGENTLPPQVKAIVADCGFTNAYAQFRYLMGHQYHIPAFPLLNLADKTARKKAGYSLKEADALGQVRKTQVPILFIHGAADDNNPVSMVYELYGASAGPKKLLIIPQARHAMSFHDAPDLYRNTVKDFLSAYIH
ncbi:alpha/beta hydrolase [Mucilaginibacter sp. CAU 1740]|uniref:alpha/beta hydrolase n=1 Tax=Mucilaginibacter sp. CAU 1740 TaxID=3140365 RepID=UPI00325B1C85